MSRIVKNLRTMLVAGPLSHLLHEYELDIVNKEPLMLDQTLSFCQQSQLRYEQILITDDGLTGLDIYAIKSALTGLSLLREKNNQNQTIRMISNRVALQDVSIAGITIEVYDSIRIPMQIYINAIIGEGTHAPAKKTRPKNPTNKDGKPPPKKRSIVERFRKGKSAEADTIAPDKEFENISREISRVIAITGHRGAGITSTAINLAHIANNRNISTMLIDLDTINCAFNLYFSEYYELAEKNQDIACSLIRNLAKPQNYTINAYYDNNLYVVALSYSFADKGLLERLFTPSKFINMLSTFRKHFQLCLLDMPLEILSQQKESILYIDLFGMCVSNNLYSLTSTLRGFQHAFTQEEMELIFGKTKVVVSKYNDQASIQNEFFSPDKVCDLLLELSEVENVRGFELAGHIPFQMEFDTQLETDIPIAANDAYMEKAYSDILLRMIKGAV